MVAVGIALAWGPQSHRPWFDHTPALGEVPAQQMDIALKRGEAGRGPARAGIVSQASKRASGVGYPHDNLVVELLKSATA